MLRYIYRSSIPVFLVQEMRRDMMLSLGLCLLFEGEEQINGAVQTLMSLILHQGHTSKRMHYQIHSTMQVPICIYITLHFCIMMMLVYNRFQKLMVCLSHYRTLTALDRLTQDFDQKVHEGRDVLALTLNTSNLTV